MRRFVAIAGSLTLPKLLRELRARYFHIVHVVAAGSAATTGQSRR